MVAVALGVASGFLTVAMKLFMDMDMKGNTLGFESRGIRLSPVKVPVR